MIMVRLHFGQRRFRLAVVRGVAELTGSGEAGISGMKLLAQWVVSPAIREQTRHDNR
jgi:hypothetical protein